jgi:hypothetical protein
VASNALKCHLHVDQRGFIDILRSGGFSQFFKALSEIFRLASILVRCNDHPPFIEEQIPNSSGVPRDHVEIVENYSF